MDENLALPDQIASRITRAKMTQIKSHRRPKIPAAKLLWVEKAAAFARSMTKIKAKAASVHVIPSTTGPWAP